MDLSPEKYRHDLEIIRETAKQVIRDFKIHKYDVTFSGNELLAYDELVNQLIPILDEMYKFNRSGFMAMLYQIDISESSFRKLVNTTKPEKLAIGLAEMIVRREFQKVLTRKFFSKKAE